MKVNSREILSRRQADLEARLDPSWQPETHSPVFGTSGGSIRYDASDRVSAIEYGGLGIFLQLVDHLNLGERIDDGLHLLKRHLPYHESDHVLNMVYNTLSGGECLEDLEFLRQDVGYLDALGARRIPDPTTSGDFLRRFTAHDIENLMDIINDARREVWLKQPKDQRKLAIIDVDGTTVETTGDCKEGADFDYKGRFGYGPLVVSLANSQEVLYTVNRPANQPSHTGSVKWMNKAVAWALDSGFEQALLRGDTDFSLTKEFDSWYEERVKFVFGIDAHPTFINRTSTLEETWRILDREKKKRSSIANRQRPANIRRQKVIEREYTNYRLIREEIAEMEYSPTACKKTYRMIVLRKFINVEKGQQKIQDEVRYHFYVTNIPKEELKAEEIVFESNARCHQENLIEQLKNGVRATRMPAGDLTANWAYMVITSLAWNLKAWMGLLLPRDLGGKILLKMEFRRFLNSVMKIPAQILRSGRQRFFRLLALGGRWGSFLLDASDWLRKCRRTS